MNNAHNKKTLLHYLEVGIASVSLLRDDVVKTIFDFTRNLLIAAGVMFAAVQWMKILWDLPEKTPLVSLLWYPAWFLLLVGLLLYLLNLTHGMKKVLEATQGLQSVFRLALLLVCYAAYAIAASTLLVMLVFLRSAS
jgi:hypothetical protein